MENIMLMDEKKELVKIVDFGLSNQFDDDNPLRTQCGSPEYAAPELFVKGKKYGPEVDLWSLGVILYVMGTGQLPFTSPRDGQTSSEERRRRLMAQINRGLAAAQERTIAPLSADYRNLLARLLTPVAHKRILVKELCRHPWIVGRQKLTWSLQMNEDRDLNVTEQNAVLDVIANITNLQRSVVETSIRNKKYGKIGGLFNIMMHEVQRNTLASLFKMQRNITLRMLEKTNSLASSNGSRIKSIQTPPRKKAHIENQESNKVADNSFSIAEYDRNFKKNVSFSVQHKIPIKRSSNIAERLELFNRKAATPNLKKADDRPKTQPCSKKASTPNSSIRPHSYLTEVRNRTLKSDPPSLFQRIAQGTRTQRNVSGASRQSRIIGKVQQSAVGMGQGDERRTSLLRQAKIKQDALIKARATLEATKARERLRGELTSNTKFSRNNESDNSRYYLKKPQNLIKNLDKLKWKNYTFTQSRLDNNEKKKNLKTKVENSSKRTALPRITKDGSKKVIQLH